VPPLAARIRERIERDGPISFRDFMDAALYDPEEGYYSRGAPIGEPGDFATSPSISPAFAAALARQFRRETAAFEGRVDFVEVGSGDGRFLRDFAGALATQDPDFAARVDLAAVEATAEGRRRIAEREWARPPRLLAAAGDLAERSIRGWIFSNELFDALPVARLEGSAEGARELRVAAEGGRFAWVAAPAPPDLLEPLAAFGIVLAPGQRAEVAPGAAELYSRLARALDRGALVTFDYGHRASVLYHPAARASGTLAVHASGRRGGDPLDRPGEVDLTAHVNWDLLRRAGEVEGLVTRGVVRQGSYLIRAGIFDFAAGDREKWRAYRLVDPEGMGEELSALVQTRGVERWEIGRSDTR
jgi:SAM-dependent MidA family methyltransferase